MHDIADQNGSTRDALSGAGRVAVSRAHHVQAEQLTEGTS